jgi:hypothetical protein
MQRVCPRLCGWDSTHPFRLIRGLVNAADAQTPCSNPTPSHTTRSRERRRRGTRGGALRGRWCSRRLVLVAVNWSKLPGRLSEKVCIISLLSKRARPTTVPVCLLPSRRFLAAECVGVAAARPAAEAPAPATVSYLDDLNRLAGHLRDCLATHWGGMCVLLLLVCVVPFTLYAERFGILFSFSARVARRSHFKVCR